MTSLGKHSTYLHLALAVEKFSEVWSKYACLQVYTDT